MSREEDEENSLPEIRCDGVVYRAVLIGSVVSVNYTIHVSTARLWFFLAGFFFSLLYLLVLS